jgi:hypothetical protein
MVHLEFSEEITALLVIDPYNKFISAGPPSIDNRTARIRTESHHYRRLFCRGLAPSSARREGFAPTPRGTPGARLGFR